ncbi:MAG TPA: cell division protein ZapA [Alphaproteobacteria bacterium]
MGEVSLAIHGKSYGVACDDGQEPRVSHLGKYVDSRLREIAVAGAASNESHLLVLTAIVLADEIHELREAMRHMKPVNGNAQAVQQPQPQQGMSKEDEREIASAIEHLASRINSIATRIQEV